MDESFLPFPEGFWVDSCPSMLVDSLAVTVGYVFHDRGRDVEEDGHDDLAHRLVGLHNLSQLSEAPSAPRIVL